jgi:hypothetical protein
VQQTLKDSESEQYKAYGKKMRIQKTNEPVVSSCFSSWYPLARAEIYLKEGISSNRENFRESTYLQLEEQDRKF